jgi:hypothetical protein
MIGSARGAALEPIEALAFSMGLIGNGFLLRTRTGRVLATNRFVRFCSK